MLMEVLVLKLSEAIMAGYRLILVLNFDVVIVK